MRDRFADTEGPASAQASWQQEKAGSSGGQQGGACDWSLI